MIVITGPGRSGTSLLAQIYRRAGADIAGAWSEDISAGLEDPEVVRLNVRLLHQMGVHPQGLRRAPSLDNTDIPAGLKRLVRSSVPPAARQRLRRAFQSSRLGGTSELALIPWGRVPQIVERFREEIAALSADRTIVKDPNFAWTLPVWLRAGAPITHVVVTVREVDAVVTSRAHAGHLRWSAETGRNATIYEVGNLLTALADSGTPHTVLRFPDFLADRALLQRQLPVLNQEMQDRLHAAINDVVDPSRVHVRST